MTNNWLISYPKSGSNFLRYCIEFMTGLPTEGELKLHKLEGKDRPGWCSPSRWRRANCQNKLILKRDHNMNSAIASFSSAATENICFLVRNYRELYYRHDPSTPRRRYDSMHPPPEFSEITTRLNSYFDFYKEYAGKKKIIYYEDLLSGTDDIEMLLTEFYDCKLTHDIREFKKQIVYHREQSLALLYNPRFSDSYSERFFQESVPMEELCRLDKDFEKALGTNFKFVERYRICD